jgi:hypothetical protein
MLQTSFIAQPYTSKPLTDQDSSPEDVIPIFPFIMFTGSFSLITCHHSYIDTTSNENTCTYLSKYFLITCSAYLAQTSEIGFCP